MTATATARAEIEALLEQDDTRLGAAFRGLRRGLSYAEIAQSEGVATSGWLSHQKQTIEALCEGKMPSSPGIARTVASRHRSLLAQPLSDETRQYLVANLQRLDANSQGGEAETREAVERTELALATEVGVYVYSFPKYLQNPEPNGRTKMKVGHSGSDVMQRFIQQARSSCAAEDAVLLRVYRSDESRETERRFHRMLDAAGHRAPRGKWAGVEWFDTSLRFLDIIAQEFGLVAVEVNDLGADF